MQAILFFDSLHNFLMLSYICKKVKIVFFRQKHMGICLSFFSFNFENLKKFRIVFFIGGVHKVINVVVYQPETRNFHSTF